MKVLLSLVAVSILAVFGVVYWQSGESKSQSGDYAEVLGVQITPENYDMGDIPINGGNVTREYEILNTSDKPIKLNKIVTSCMCTKAKISVGDKESRFFGMEHPGDKNPPINIDIQPGEIAKVTAEFDPMAHGPQGTGPFGRVVTLNFSNPVGVIKLTFGGTVVK